MRKRWMMKCDVWWMKNERMLLIESHCWIEWDEWERREEEIDFGDWEEKWLFWEREIECVVYEMWMSGHGWLLLRRWIDDDLYDRYWWVECVFVFSSTMREREREREIYIQIDWRVIEMIINWNWEMSEWLKCFFQS